MRDLIITFSCVPLLLLFTVDWMVTSCMDNKKSRHWNMHICVYVCAEMHRGVAVAFTLSHTVNSYSWNACQLLPTKKKAWGSWECWFVLPNLSSDLGTKLVMGSVLSSMSWTCQNVECSLKIRWTPVGNKLT